MGLLDKEKVVVELEKRHSRNSKNKLNLAAAFEDNYILSFLDTLEVKDVDLELEITLWANAIPEIRLDDVERLAKYFFELGLKLQKENKL